MIRLSVIALALLIVRCGTRQGEFYSAALGLNKPRIIVSSAFVSGTNTTYSIVAYDTNGTFLGRLADYNFDGSVPRGLALFGNSSFIVALNGVTRLDKIKLDRTISTFADNSNLTGAIYDIVKDSSNRYYVINGNKVEMFDSLGVKSPSGATGFVNGATGSCTALSNPQSLAINSFGHLVVANATGGVINSYTISTGSAACYGSPVTFTTPPLSMISHSNGNLYIGGTNSQIYSAGSNGSSGTSIYNNTTIISTPRALLELPDGTILVASNGTSSIERIRTDGSRVGTTSFIKDSFTNGVEAMLLVPGM